MRVLAVSNLRSKFLRQLSLTDGLISPVQFDVPRGNDESTHFVRLAPDGSWELYLHGFEDSPIRVLNEFESGFIDGAFMAGAEFTKRLAWLILPN